LQFVTDLDEEMAVHRRWAAEQRVHGVLLIDPRLDDPRPAVLDQLRVPYVVAGGTRETNGVWLDDDATMSRITGLLTGTGHRRIARVSRPDGLVHTAVRDAAFRRAGAEVIVVRGDYTGASGARLTRELLGRERPPTAIVYDNDLMAIAGLGVAHQMGVTVPADLSVVAWEDSPLCRFVSPPLTAVEHDIAAFGGQAARLLLARLDGEASGFGGPGAGLLVRRSTGPARGEAGQRWTVG
jgi:DNA-binding LacI/PurR family transcriptional regulator